MVISENQKAKSEQKLSPMLLQYKQIKEQYKDYILFFRLGDFYEMFFEDAMLVSRELELTLTARAGTPMCGVPHHSSEGYIKKLIEKGYKVAVCEQTTDPALSKGLVEREVVRLVTAGTVIEASMLDEGKNNYIACIYAEKNHVGMAFSDVSTGEIHVVEKSGRKLQNQIISELSRYNPAEILFNSSFLDFLDVHHYIKNRLVKTVGELIDDDYFIEDNELLKEQFTNENALEKLCDGDMKKALCALMRYFGNMRKSRVRRFVKLNIHENDELMDINISARKSLELTETMRSSEKKGSLLWVLDKTSTSMGKRLLKSWVEQPLISPTAIIKRLDAVDSLIKNPVVLFDICESLAGIYDLERLITRIVFKSATPRDIVALGKACQKLPTLKNHLKKLKTGYINSLDNDICELSDIFSLVDNAIIDEPPISLKDGGVIKDGFNENLDKLRNITKNSKDILAKLEQQERDSTGIKNLKVGYNRVFGYYIEVSKSNTGNVPANYIRKQTLTNGERYITEELKAIENDILSANDKIIALEEEIFTEVRKFISAKLEQIQQTAFAVAQIDVLCSFASVSIDNNYVKPEITLESVIDIKDGRHPVIEKMLTEKPFTPNDSYLDNNQNRLLIITGPNMSGKSTFMRQTALIVLMAQMGCFVPAKKARIGVCDKIFTRVGASDDLSSGLSTFMVEMNEVAEILSNATSKSLVILDEIGRGTSTFDGISIARAVAEHITKIGCKTLFATHYHELISMEKEYEGIRNFSVSVSKKGDGIRFLHKIVEGGVDDSYGIEVAKLAGLPKKVIDKAKSELSKLEVNSLKNLNKTIEMNKEKEQFDFSALAEENVINKIKNIELDDITAEKSMEFLKEIKEMLI